MTEKKKNRAIILRLKESSLIEVKKQAVARKMSVNEYINTLLNLSTSKEQPSFKEIVDTSEKKEIKNSVYLTLSEATLLKKYASLNGWSMAKEIRYRLISTLSKKPELNKEELKAIYALRSSINILGANLNRLIRENESLSDANIEVCQSLVELIKELREKINYLEKSR